MTVHFNKILKIKISNLLSNSLTHLTIIELTTLCCPVCQFFVSRPKRLASSDPFPAGVDRKLL
jgi:hypothetical protein